MKIFLKFFRYLKTYLKPLIAANGFMLLFVVFSVISIGLVMPFMDLLFNPEMGNISESVKFSFFNLQEYLTYQLKRFTEQYTKKELLGYISILMIVSFFLKNLFAYLQKYFMSIVEQGMIQDIQLDLYKHLHKLSLGFFTEEKKGNLISRIINDVKIINDSIVAVTNSAFRDPPQIITYTIILFIFNWELTLLIFLMLPVIAIILSKIGNSLKRTSIKSQEKISDITTILDETLSAMKIVKAFNMQSYEIEKFKAEIGKYYKLLIKLIRRRALASPITEVIGVGFITLILYFMGSRILEGKTSITPGAFLVYLGFVFQMMPALKLFGQVFNSIKEGIAAGERVFSTMEIQPKIVNSNDAIKKDTFVDKIEFINVHSKYETGGVVLKNITLTIQKGKVAALVGPSGAGKSTLVDLIPRFYDVIEGEILLDKINIKKIDIFSLRELIGIVDQETILFNDTIKKNIIYGSKNYSEESIIEAAKASNAHNFIEELPEKYETIIGDRGIKLSGGQRQRLSIARALIKNPPILILDEATSSLDTESELLVQQAIERLMQGRTSIVIAHRLSTILDADKIIVLDKGRIVEEGTHKELFDNNGLYYKLYNMQFKEENKK